MANRLYAKGKENFLKGAIHWHTDSIDALLIDTNHYTPDMEKDATLQDIPNQAWVGQLSGNTDGPYFLSQKTTNGGVAGAAPVIFDNAVGLSCGAVVLFAHRIGAENTLIAYIDEVQGFPVSPVPRKLKIEWAGDIIFSL